MSEENAFVVISFSLLLAVIFMIAANGFQ